METKQKQGNRHHSNVIIAFFVIEFFVALIAIELYAMLSFLIKQYDDER